jgi:hypothetical protein
MRGVDIHLGVLGTRREERPRRCGGFADRSGAESGTGLAEHDPLIDRHLPVTTAIPSRIASGVMTGD